MKGQRYRRADKFKTLGTFVCARYERVKETSGVSYERSEYSFFSITTFTTDAIGSFASFETFFGISVRLCRDD